MPNEELIWAAGLFEGEGHVRVGSERSRGHIAALSMTDEDVIRRFQNAVGFGRVRGPIVRGGHKPVFIWTACNFQDVQALMCFFWRWLGQRRREQFKAAVLRRPMFTKGRYAI
jgi:hypothetical protein